MKKILVSQCLYGGEPVRYDGKDKAEEDSRFLKWKEEGRLVPICPEVFGGLPTPRSDAQRVADKVIARTGKDVTAEYMKGAHEAVRLAKEHDVICAIMKEKSPSCGSNRIYDGSFDGTLIPGQGTAVELLRKAGVKVFSEEELDEAEEMLKNIEETSDAAISEIGNMFDGKKAIIFDMDGTLIDSVGIWNAVDMEILKRYGRNGAAQLTEKQVQQQRDHLLRLHKSDANPYEEYYRDLKGKYDFSVSAEEAIRVRYDLAREMLAEIIGYKPGAAELLKSLKERGFVLAIASTTKRANMEVYRNRNQNIISKAPIDETFSLVYTREDVTEMKPDPAIYIKTMADLGFEPSECLIFEDSLIGAEAAKASGAGVAVIYDKYSDDEREEINRLADYSIDDYQQALNILLEK